MDQNPLAEALAAAALAGPLTGGGLVERWAEALGKKPRWLGSLAGRLVNAFGENSRPRRFHIVRFLRADFGLANASTRGLSPPAVAAKPKMCPAGKVARAWKVPRILTPAALARWLDVPFDQLAWFADTRTLERLVPKGPLRHYRYRWLTKRDGSARISRKARPLRPLSQISPRGASTAASPVSRNRSRRTTRATPTTSFSPATPPSQKAHTASRFTSGPSRSKKALRSTGTSFARCAPAFRNAPPASS